MILTSLYTGSLTAFIASNEVHLKVKDLQSLVENPDAKWITVNGTALESYIKTEPILAPLKLDLDTGKGQLVRTLDEAHQRILNEGKYNSLLIRKVEDPKKGVDELQSL